MGCTPSTHGLPLNGDRFGAPPRADGASSSSGRFPRPPPSRAGQTASVRHLHCAPGIGWRQRGRRRTHRANHEKVIRFALPRAPRVAPPPALVPWPGLSLACRRAGDRELVPDPSMPSARKLRTFPGGATARRWARCRTRKRRREEVDALRAGGRELSSGLGDECRRRGRGRRREHLLGRRRLRRRRAPRIRRDGVRARRRRVSSAVRRLPHRRHVHPAGQPSSGQHLPHLRCGP
jgi:hypothetical protein